MPGYAHKTSRVHGMHNSKTSVCLTINDLYCRDLLLFSVVCLLVYLRVSMCVCVLRGSKEGTEAPRPGVTDDCGPPSPGVGN